MNPIEVFVLFGAGYVSGLSSSSGFVMQGLKTLFRDQWTRGRELAWILAFTFNALVCGLMTVFLLILTVEDFARPDFWQRALTFAFGVVCGMAFVFAAAHLINLGVRSYKRGLGA